MLPGAIAATDLAFLFLPVSRCCAAPPTRPKREFQENKDRNIDGTVEVLPAVAGRRGNSRRTRIETSPPEATQGPPAPCRRGNSRRTRIETTLADYPCPFTPGGPKR